MKLGISTYAYSWGVCPESGPCMTLSQLVSKAAEFRLQCIQIGDHVPFHELTKQQVKEFHKEAADAGLEIQLGARGLKEDHIKKYIDLCARTESPLLRFVIDAKHFEPTADEVIEIINRVEPELKSAGVILGIENHDRFPARVLREIMETVDSDHVAICLDTTNSLGAGEGIHEVLEELSKHTINLHIKDFSIKRVENQMGFRVNGERAGKGMLDIPFVLDRLMKDGRCESAVLEQWPVKHSTLEQTIENEKVWVDESLTYLKQVFAKVISQITPA